MNTVKVPYTKTNFFGSLVQDYLTQNASLAPFYNRGFDINNFSYQISEKASQPINRTVLVEALKSQNKSIQLSEKSYQNIERLSNSNTFTVTTGHQLCLFTGPLYLIYKIVSTINLSKSLKKTYPNYHFVPVFWMASEDHDFEEINHIHLYGKTIEWNAKQQGAVGRMNLTDIKPVLESLFNLIGEGEYSYDLKQKFLNAYSPTNTLAQANRILINDLFKNDGLVIIDGDDKHLKSQFKTVIKNDILKSAYYTDLVSQSEKLSKEYKLQANVRAINFFKLEDNSRIRIESAVDETEIDKFPEKFSPNVLFRPLFQESILPNLAYIGGGAEIAYWMQLKSLFKSEHIVYPILVLRNSALIVSEKNQIRLQKLGFSIDDLLRSEDDLCQQYLKSTSEGADLKVEFDKIQTIFDSIKQKYADKNLLPTLDSEQKRTMNSLNKMKKKIKKIEKSKHEVALSQISNIKRLYFPKNSLQERSDNFIPFYLKHGDNFIKKLKSEFDPLDTKFVILAQ
ncbi:MAG: bacillithiol biosynthesis cysteine-adding enzyme BshC [Flavobacteriales bacterium]